MSKPPPIGPDAAADIQADVPPPCPLDDSDADADADGWTNAIELACSSDPCDPDSTPSDLDGDGVCDTLDVCPDSVDPLQQDLDQDGVGDACDNCPATQNPGQENSDADPKGDACSGGGFPNVLWIDNQPSLPMIVGDEEMSRDWSWSCEAQGGSWPVTLSCEVWDVTDATFPPTDATKLVVEDKGTADWGPAVVECTYDIPTADLVPDHKYCYAAACSDSADSSYWSYYCTWYDATPPAATLGSVTGPVDGAISFGLSCDDNSFGYDMAPFPSAHSWLLCSLQDTDTGMYVDPPGGVCDTPWVTDTTATTHSYEGLAPGAYCFEFFCRDEADHESAPQQSCFTVP